MVTPVDWTREEILNLLAYGVKTLFIQLQLERCRRNSPIYRKIADDLGDVAIVQLLSASMLQTTYDTFLALQLFLQQKIASKTVAEKLT